MSQETFRPSKANYWGKCAAYQRFTRNVQNDVVNDAAREGTCAAWVAEVVLSSEEGIECEDLVGKTHANGWVVSDDMAYDVQEYVNLMKSQGGSCIAEERITASQNPLIEGTLDTSISIINERVLKIIDLKYGRQIVEPTTKQLVCYAWGKLLKMPANTVDEIHLSIYQPRAFHHKGIYRTRVLTVAQLHEEFVKLFDMAVESAKPDSIATPGSHCDNCEAAANCESLAHTVYNLTHFVSSREQRDMNLTELSRELDFMAEIEKTVKARFKAVKTEAEARAKKENIPGWGLIPVKGNRIFTVPGVNVQLLTGVDPYVKKLCTPAELERRGGSSKEFKSKVKKITKQPTTSYKLKRITIDDIATMFKIK